MNLLINNILNIHYDIWLGSKTKLNAKEEAVKQKVMLMSSCQLKNNLIALHNFKED